MCLLTLIWAIIKNIDTLKEMAAYGAKQKADDAAAENMDDDRIDDRDEGDLYSDSDSSN